MNAVNTVVVDNILNLQKVQPGLPPLPDKLPVDGNRPHEVTAQESGVYAKTLDLLQRPLKNDGQELLKDRFLCKGSGLLLVGPTGIGKSSLSMQMMISWALGLGLFGIEPARPITSLLIQAENDEGDLAEMRDGVLSGLNVTDTDRELACSRIFVVQENTRTSEDFFNETVRPMLEEIKPDLLWIDPALAYLGGENNSQQAVGAFLRNQLNPLLTEFNCAAVVIHHTNKPYSGNEKRGPVDFAYLGGGSAEWANWSRAILTLQKTDAASVFELRAAKRGNRLGWKEVDGSTVAYNRFIAHNKEPGTICWIDIEPDLVEGLGKGNGKSDDDVLKHVPLDRPIAKNTLIVSCARDGMGKNATRDAIDALTLDGTLYEWRKPRRGTQPEKYLARIPQPLDPDGREIFTSIFTAILPREHLREDDTERCSHLHPPLGGVNICREHQDEVALLSVEGTSAREDQLPAPPPRPSQLQPNDLPMTTFPPMPETTAVPNSVPIPRPAPQPVESKAVVRLMSPRSIQSTDNDHSITVFHDPKDFWNIDLGEMLVRLGQKVLENDQGDEWFSMVQVAGLCRKYRLKWKESIKATHLEQATKDYLEKHAEIMGGGVKVECKGEFNEDKRRNELFFKFRKLYPDGMCH